MSYYRTILMNPVAQQVSRHKNYVDGFSGTIDDESYLKSVYEMEFDNNRFDNLVHLVDKRTGYLNTSGNAERWFDLTPNELSPAQATSTAKPSIQTKGLDFVKDDFFALGQPSQLNITGAISMEVWVNFNSNTRNLYGIYGAGNAQGGANNASKMISVDNDTTNGPDHFFEIANGSSDVTVGRLNTGFSANTWIHIVGTWDGTSNANAVNYYVNGLNVHSLTGITQPLLNRDWAIGTSQRFNYMDGQLARCATWNKELSSAEVTGLYNLQSSYL